MKAPYRFYVLGLLCFLCSCANVPSDFSFAAGKRTGLVIGSISYESGVGKYFLIAEGSDPSKLVVLSFGCALFPCFEPFNDAAFSSNETPKQRGGGYAVEVAEGTYRLKAWRVAQGVIRSNSRHPIDIEFTVEAGKASYLGNLHFDEHWQDVKLRDKALRDLPLLREKYAVLKTAPIAYTVAPGMEVGKLGGDYRRGTEGAFFVPFVPLRR